MTIVMEKKIEKTITKGLIQLGIPVAYSKISMADEQGILVSIEFEEKS
jgi:hypothetical protein